MPLSPLLIQALLVWLRGRNRRNRLRNFVRPPFSTLGPALLTGLLLAIPALAAPGSPPGARASEASHAPPHAGQAAGLHGSQGLLEVGSALLGRPGILRLSAVGEHGWATDDAAEIGQHRRTGATLAGSYVPLSWLELSLSWAAASHLNAAFTPSAAIHAVGDLTVGAKVAAALSPWLSGGVELTGLLFPGIVGASEGSAAFGLAPRAMLSADLHRLHPGVPLRAHLNVGGRFDGTGGLVGYGLTAAEELALSVNRHPRLTYGLGLEVPLRWVTPFAEHAAALPLGVEAPGGATLGLRHTLAAGLRITAIRDLSLTLAGQLGLSRQVAPGVAATLPFNLLFGASFNLDTRGAATGTAQAATQAIVPSVGAAQAGPPAQAATRAIVPSATHPLRGVIRDHRTGEPVPGAVVTAVGSGAPAVLSDASAGAFVTPAVPEGPARFTVEKDGYHPLTVELPVRASGAPVTLVLTPVYRPARLLLEVEGGGKRVAAQLSISGAESHEVALSASGTETIELPGGVYRLELRAAGFLAQVRDVQVSEGGTLPVRFELAEAPRKSLVVFKKDQIEILQQVRFGAGTAQLHPDSVELLRQVVDAVVRNEVKRLRIEGHTDSRGSAKVNLRLSRERAQSVADALVGLGLDRSRLDVEGHGSKRPLAPNVTARGRQLNRRVDFIVVDQER